MNNSPLGTAPIPSCPILLKASSRLREKQQNKTKRTKTKQKRPYYVMFFKVLFFNAKAIL